MIIKKIKTILNPILIILTFLFIYYFCNKKININNKKQSKIGGTQKEKKENKENEKNEENEENRSSNEYLSDYICNNFSNSKNIKVLYIVGVENTAKNISLMKSNYELLKIYDNITWCFNHFDGTNTKWKKHSWYNNLNCIKNIGIGSKVTQWLKITPDIAKQYDYLWLSDGDIGLESFNWNVYANMLKSMNILLSQPAILPHKSGRASDHKWLCFKSSKKNTIQLTKKNIEVMTPFISTKIWNLIYEKMILTDNRSIWETEFFFNKIIDDLNQPKFINFKSPVIHYDYRNLKKIKSIDAKRKLLHSPEPYNYKDKILKIKYIISS